MLTDRNVSDAKKLSDGQVGLRLAEQNALDVAFIATGLAGLAAAVFSIASGLIGFDNATEEFELATASLNDDQGAA